MKRWIFNLSALAIVALGGTHLSAQVVAPVVEHCCSGGGNKCCGQNGCESGGSGCSAW